MLLQPNNKNMNSKVSISYKGIKLQLKQLYDYHLLFLILTSVVWFVPITILITVLIILLQLEDKKELTYNISNSNL